ncbi:MAG: Pseudouridine synthase [Thermocaproicibacter melissae]|jgi:16S rRNA pseudouridine516 synthase|uniref:pseudouridine synthase n=1 Tax=Thermocaproicibacter melissae TaxID=2966552 RepID=UPI003A0FD384
MKAERLDKILASQNAGTRKEVGTMIRAGRVSVNGKTVLRPEFKADPEHDTVELDGAVLTVKKHLYLMMNKPSGVLSDSRNPKAQTVIDLLPHEWRRRGMFPAGRLDKDTEGLLILTDDGDFAHRMLAPKSHVKKWYEAVLAHPVTEEDVQAFRKGLELADMTCLPAELIPAEGGASAAIVKLREGKFHQVKRMFLARGNKVLALRRIRIGDLPLDESLSPGESRELSASELEQIFRGKLL